MICNILSHRALSREIFDLRLSFAPETPPAPGQFLHVAAPGHLLRRPISLCGFDGRAARLVYAVRGEGTRALSRLSPGQGVDVLGPLGNGFATGTDRVLLVGGGVGLPPLIFFQNSHGGPTRFVAGFRTRRLAALAGELRDAVLCTDDGSLGVRAYPHEQARELLRADSFDRVLACGPAPLLKAVSELCREMGIPCFVSMEERMGCGVGACLVCACSVGGHYRRVCMDGPVFPGEEVDFS